MNINHIAGSLDNIKFVAIEAKYGDKWVLCLHKRRHKWECPGGHVENGETPLTAAKRELFEETGASEYELIPVWDYECFDDGKFINNGRVYFARISKFENLPENEMERIGFFGEIPENVTYDRNEMIEMLHNAEKYASAHFE